MSNQTETKERLSLEEQAREKGVGFSWFDSDEKIKKALKEAE